MKCKNCARFFHVNEDMERTVGEPNWCFYIQDSPCEDLERECKAFKPLSNADRIRNMSDSEIAEFIIAIREAHRPSTFTNGGYCLDGGEIPDNFWIVWLQQEADNGQN